MPRFPRTGSSGPGSPPSAVLSGHYDFPHRMSFGLCIRQPGPWLPAAVSCPPSDPGGKQASRRARSLGHPGLHLRNLSPRANAGSPRFPGNPSHDFATFPRPRTTRGTSPCRCFQYCPRSCNSEGVIICEYRGSIAALCHLLSTLHDPRHHGPCKTRFRLAGCAFAGQGSNLLGCGERFQFISSPFPDLRLALCKLRRAGTRQCRIHRHRSWLQSHCSGVSRTHLPIRVFISAIISAESVPSIGASKCTS